MKLESTSGGNNRAAILDEEQARKIWNLKGREQAELVAASYGVSVHCVKDIWRKRTWKCLHKTNKGAPRDGN